MPRQKKVVQKQKRQKVYRPGELDADARHVKPRGAFRLFTNYKLFAIIGIFIIGGGFLISAFYRGNQSTTNSTGSPRGSGVTRSTPEANSTNTNGPTGAAKNIKQYGAPPPLTIDMNKTYTATIKTDQGDIVVQLNPGKAPATVNNFVFLANDHFYDGSTFFRVADQNGTPYYAQAGDPTGTGSGGPGYDLPVETTDVTFTAGVLGMAKPNEAGAPNNGSQFFFTLTSVPTIDGKFTAFGTVTSGLDVLQHLQPHQSTDTDPGARIETITVSSS